MNVTNTTNTTTNDLCQEHVQQFHPTGYVFWWLSIFILNLILLFCTLFGTYLRLCHPDYKTKSNSSKKSVSFARTLLIESVKPVNTLAMFYFSICRILWLLDPHPNSKTFGGNMWANEADDSLPMSARSGGRPAIAFLISTPQTMALLGMTLLISLWRRITNNAQHIRRHAKSIKTETCAIVSAALFLLLVALPLAIAASWVPSVVFLSNACFGLYMLVLVSGGVYYISVLHKIIAKIQSKKSKQVVFQIEITIIAASLACFLIVGGIIYDQIAMDRCLLKTSAAMNTTYLTFIWLIHAGEWIGCMAVAYAIFPLRSTPKSSKRSSSGMSSLADPNRRGSNMSTTAYDLEEDRIADDDTSVSGGSGSGGSGGGGGGGGGGDGQTELLTVVKEGTTTTPSKYAVGGGTGGGVEDDTSGTIEKPEVTTMENQGVTP